jgi:hypothetical protein
MGDGGRKKEGPAAPPAGGPAPPDPDPETPGLVGSSDLRESGVGSSRCTTYALERTAGRARPQRGGGGGGCSRGLAVYSVYTYSYSHSTAKKNV